MDSLRSLPLHDSNGAAASVSISGLPTSSTDGLQTPTEHHGGHLHTGRRLRKLLRPNGRRVHVAASPEEHLRLTHTLPKIEPDDNFDCYVHGSAEHLEAIREIHAHHESRRDTLKDKHGTIYDEIEHVKTELDTLAEELHHLSDHGVSLDANFSKFGYDAHIRTRDPESSASSISGDRSSIHEKRDWAAERRKGQALKFWKKPTMRQVSEQSRVFSYFSFSDVRSTGIRACCGAPPMLRKLHLLSSS